MRCCSAGVEWHTGRQPSRPKVGSYAMCMLCSELITEPQALMWIAARLCIPTPRVVCSACPTYYIQGRQTYCSTWWLCWSPFASPSPAIHTAAAECVWFSMTATVPYMCSTCDNGPGKPGVCIVLLSALLWVACALSSMWKRASATFVLLLQYT